MSISWQGGSYTFANGYAVGISRDVERNGDGTVLFDKHNISIRGSIVASGSSTSERWQNLISAAGTVGTFSSGGRDYGSLSFGSVVYSNALLTSVSTSEPPEDTAGAHFIEVTLTFEAIGSNIDSGLKSASETIEFKKELDQKGFEGNNIDVSPRFGYTITHSISAAGYATNMADAYTAAKAWVEDKAADSSVGLMITTDASSELLLDPFSVDDFSASLPSDEYNVVRTSSADPVGGSYNISTTYFRAAFSSISDINIDIQKDDSGDISVSVNGSIKGLTSGGPDVISDNSLSYAELAFGVICGDFGSSSKVYSLATSAFGTISHDGLTLDDEPLSLSSGSNKLSGTRTFNVSYKAYPSAIQAIRKEFNAISVSLSITDDNSTSGQDIQIFASIPVIGRIEGPVLQNMNTTRERRRSVQLDVTVKPPSRTLFNESVLAACIAKVSTYAPGGTAYLSNKNATWDANSGRASASMEWTYQ